MRFLHMWKLWLQILREVIALLYVVYQGLTSTFSITATLITDAISRYVKLISATERVETQQS